MTIEELQTQIEKHTDMMSKIDFDDSSKEEWRDLAISAQTLALDLAVKVGEQQELISKLVEKQA